MRRRVSGVAVRFVVGYGAALAGAAFALTWLEYQYLVRAFPTEAYMILLAAAFLALGLWAGRRMAPAPPAGFARNDAALAALGISEREFQTLELLADGLTNKEIARQLSVSPNTVKTHVGHLYGKLEVSRRTQAVQRARALSLIP